MRTAEVGNVNAADFYKDLNVVDAYSVRPGYPPEAIQYVLEIMSSQPWNSETQWRILDAGCGSGQLTEALINADIQSKIFAMDQSKAMVSALHEKIPEGVTLLLGNFNEMPFGDEKINLIAFGTAIHWGDPDRLPGELDRLLLPSGLVVSISNITRKDTEYSAILDEIPDHAAKVNPMTIDPRRIELGRNFVFVGFIEFKNDLVLSPSDFFKLLASIELFRSAPQEAAFKAWRKMQMYARKHTVDGHIVVPFDTYIRIAQVIKPVTVGAMACQKSVEE